MNLQLLLISRIVLAALFSLLVSAGWLVYDSHRQAMQSTQTGAHTLVRQLELQLSRQSAGLGEIKPFPDFELWKQSAHSSGVCVELIQAANASTTRLCTGSRGLQPVWPDWFDSLYRQLFQPGRTQIWPVAFNGSVYATLLISPEAELEIAMAWQHVSGLAGLTVLTLAIVCSLVYFSVSRALKPAEIIVNGLELMEQDNPEYRLPDFSLREWQRIAAALNQFSASRRNLLAEQRRLTFKLLNLQEDERRELARELHDEFGQCLAAINAATTGIEQSAGYHADIGEDAGRIKRITGHMMDAIRSLLMRLRPAGFDELGLAASLQGLVASWNSTQAGRIRFTLNLSGQVDGLSPEQSIALFRIVQEGINNIVKHASASQAEINLAVASAQVCLQITDNGSARELPFAKGGVGLPGIQERAAGFNGRMELAIIQPQGLKLTVSMPVSAEVPA